MAFTIALLSINSALGADAPIYNNGVLTIPHVDTATQLGQYQDITFKLTDQGNWQLLNLKAIGTVIDTLDTRLVPLSRVEIVMTNTFPTQVFLRLSGGLSGCFSQTLGQINQQLVNNQFNVVVTASYYVDPYTPGLCPAISSSFVKTIPLAVYGLSAGTYSYNVNGITGTFQLVANNMY